MRRLALIVLAAPGCIALPVALPPAKSAIGVAAAIGNPLPDVDGTPLTEAEAIIPGRIGVSILSMWPELNRRPFEVDGGYAFQVFPNKLRLNRNRHGGFLGVSALLGHFWLGENWRVRIVVRGSGEIYGLQDHPGWGGGGSWAVGAEIAKFDTMSSDTCDGPCFLGVLAGEWSVGGELLGGYYTIDGADYGVVGFAITARWPGMAGLAVLPLSGSF